MRTVLILVAAAAFSQEVVLDRIAVTVGAQAITELEILDEIRIASFLNGEALDFSPKSRREAAERLIDQHLIRRDMRAIRYPEPETSEAEKMLGELKRTRFGGSQERYRAAIEKYGVPEQQLKEHLLWQLAALRFTDYRFRADVPKPPETHQLEKEFTQRAEARTAAANDGRPPRTDEPEGLPQSVDRQMDEWLKEARKQTRIKFREEAFQP